MGRVDGVVWERRDVKCEDHRGPEESCRLLELVVVDEASRMGGVIRRACVWSCGRSVLWTRQCCCSLCFLLIFGTVFSVIGGLFVVGYCGPAGMVW